MPRDAQAPDPLSPRRVGLVAAWGNYPLVVARALKQQHYEVYCLGVMEHADREALEPVVADFEWIGLARLGKAIRYFQRHHVTQATMAGKFHKRILYRPWIWFQHLPDWTTARWFYPHFGSGSADRKDDTLLSRLVDGFATAGVTFGPATNYAPELLVKFGQLTRREPTAAQRKDIEFGWQHAKEMGRLDIGQSVIVKDQAVIAVEAIEGTDECIRRAGTLCQGFTLVKVAKPSQDMRFDVPTVGLRTLQRIHEAGGRVLAIEADKTIVVDDLEEFCRLAEKLKVAVVAVSEESSDVIQRRDASQPIHRRLHIPTQQAVREL